MHNGLLIIQKSSAVNINYPTWNGIDNNCLDHKSFMAYQNIWWQTVTNELVLSKYIVNNDEMTLLKANFTL